MNEPFRPHKENVGRHDQLVKGAVDVVVPVARKFTINYYGDDEPSGQMFTITLEVLKSLELDGSAPFLPLKLTIGSADHPDLVRRCFEVVQTGFIKAKGELVIDHLIDQFGRVEHCDHLIAVTSFEPVYPHSDAGPVFEALCAPTDAN